VRGGVAALGLRHRVLRHAWVVLIAFVLPFVAPRLPAAASPPPLPEGSEVISAVIDVPPPDPPPPGPALTVIAPQGATEASLAAEYGRDASAIQWANDLVAGSAPSPGSEVLLPPGPGALVEVLPGETPSQFASRLHLDPTTVLAYNLLDADTPLPAGTYLQVPISSAPMGALNSAAFIPEAAGVPEVPPSHGHDGFPYGQCTYYVAGRVDVSWSGNADAWWENARGLRPEGDVPVAGAIAVFDYWPLGHVALVTQVNLDGSFQIEEMNYGGWARIDSRTISDSDPSLVGFIY